MDRLARAVAEFDRLEPFDWNDLAEVSRRTEPLLRKIFADKTLFEALVRGSRTVPALWSKCEEDVVEDKIVLYDDPSRGFRLRLRMAKVVQEELAHEHRFSFTTLVLNGRYLHRTYHLDREFGPGVTADDFAPVWVHEDGPGDVFTIHHSAIHSTPLAEPGTITLILRGPAMKERAPVLFREERVSVLSPREQAEQLEGAVPGEAEPVEAERGTFFWRVGEASESKTRRGKRQMSPDAFERWVDYMSASGLF